MAKSLKNFWALFLIAVAYVFLRYALMPTLEYLPRGVQPPEGLREPQRSLADRRPCYRMTRNTAPTLYITSSATVASPLSLDPCPGEGDDYPDD